MYMIYVDNKPVHTCDSWYEAHTLSTDLHSIDEWYGLSSYTELDGLPIWGNTPEEQEKPDTKRRLRSIREEQIRNETRNEKELERDGLVKFAELVKKRQAEL